MEPYNHCLPGLPLITESGQLLTIQTVRPLPCVLDITNEQQIACSALPVLYSRQQNLLHAGVTHRNVSSLHLSSATTCRSRSLRHQRTYHLCRMMLMKCQTTCRRQPSALLRCHHHCRATPRCPGRCTDKQLLCSCHFDFMCDDRGHGKFGSNQLR